METGLGIKRAMNALRLLVAALRVLEQREARAHRSFFDESASTPKASQGSRAFVCLSQSTGALSRSRVSHFLKFQPKLDDRSEYAYRSTRNLNFNRTSL